MPADVHTANPATSITEEREVDQHDGRHEDHLPQQRSSWRSGSPSSRPPSSPGRPRDASRQLLGGGSGIRTHGTPKEVQQFSRLSPSSARPSLQMDGYGRRGVWHVVRTSAEGVGFEPTEPENPIQQFSRLPPSSTRPSLRCRYMFPRSAEIVLIGRSSGTSTPLVEEPGEQGLGRGAEHA